MTAPLRLFQIFHDDATRAALDPGFEPLDNTAPDRPGWYEYGPMLRALDRVDLRAPGRYGFFSPRFRRKTGLTAREVTAFVHDSPHADVITFSTFPEHGAYFLNPIEQGDLFHPGLLAAADRASAALFGRSRIAALVNHAQNTVFANFFVARGAFWLAWREVVMRAMRIAADERDPLHGVLEAATAHHGTVLPRMRIFVLERAASALLAADPAWRVAAFQPLRMPVSHPWFEARREDMAALDATKAAYAATGDTAALDAFRSRRAEALAAPGHPWHGAWKAHAAGPI